MKQYRYDSTKRMIVVWATTTLAVLAVFLLGTFEMREHVEIGRFSIAQTSLLFWALFPCLSVYTIIVFYLCIQIRLNSNQFITLTKNEVRIPNRLLGVNVANISEISELQSFSRYGLNANIFFKEVVSLRIITSSARFLINSGFFDDYGGFLDFVKEIKNRTGLQVLLKKSILSYNGGNHR